MIVVWAGLSIGALYALIALGYNMVLVASGVFNFAYAQLIMLAVYFSYTAVVILKLPIWGVVVFSAGCVAVIAMAEERVAIRPLAARLDLHGTLITTIGVATLIDGLVLLFWGTQPLTVPVALDNEQLQLLGASIQPTNLLLILLVPIVAILLHVWSHKTILGLASLAPAEDREAAMVRGIDVKRVAMISFCISGLIAGAAGILIAPQTYADPSLAQNLALLGFVALAIGGSGHQLGGVVGGFATGLAYAVAERYLNSTWADIIVFAAFLVVLMARPRGILGKPIERYV
jgi:branched-chain amino acid transport system permease protein